MPMVQPNSSFCSTQLRGISLQVLPRAEVYLHSLLFHPSLLPSYKEAFAPILDYSGPNPCFCHQNTPLCRLSKEKEIFPLKKSVLFPQETGGMFSPFLPTPVSLAPRGGWTSFSPGHIFQRFKGLVCRITSSLSLQGAGLLPKTLLLSQSRGRTKPDPNRAKGISRRISPSPQL